jgi:hypothetical protein
MISYPIRSNQGNCVLCGGCDPLRDVVCMSRASRSEGWIRAVALSSLSLENSRVKRLPTTVAKRG